MLGTHNLYDKGIFIVKQYGQHKTKVIFLPSVRKSGFENGFFDTKENLPSLYIEKNSVNSEKLLCNLSRTKSKVQELALCNPWTYFVTLTIDPKKYDRHDLKKFWKDLSQFIRDKNKRRLADKKIKYLLIPEKHKDGAWHVHGLLYGLSDDDLHINSNGYFDWLAYSKRFGYISLDIVKDSDRVSSYILKYITKDLSRCVSELGGHLYRASQGLETAEILYRGSDIELLCSWDYEHPDGYCKIKTFDDRNECYTDFIRLE